MSCMTTLTTRLRIAAWGEKPVARFDDGSKITRATVDLRTEPTDLKADAWSRLCTAFPTARAVT